MNSFFIASTWRGKLCFDNKTKKQKKQKKERLCDHCLIFFQAI